MKKGVAATCLVVALAVTSVVGCSGGQEQKSAGTASADVAGNLGGADFSYPMPAGDKVTFWGPLNTTESPNYANRGETPFAKALMERTGVEIEFLHPPTGQDKEQFSLILADGNLPDMMEYDWLTVYPGGPEKAIRDGVILPLNDIFEQYCPNITKYLQEHPEIDKMIKTDEGNYYAFPFIRGDERLGRTMGLMLRGDWLEELGLEVPTTIDEWHTVLTAFKDQKGADAPYCPVYTRVDIMKADPFLAAYEVGKDFYINDEGEVRYDGVEEGYKEYLTTMAQWYEEDLIDPDLATLKFDQVSAKMTNGSAGSTTGYAGSGMGVWMAAATATNPDYLLVPAPVPTLEKGQTPEFGYMENQYAGKASTAITTSCKDVARVARLLDYAYGEEGSMLYNFGVEGESYHLVDGEPVYSDWITNNPEGWPVGQAMSAYIRGNTNGAFIQDYRYLTQYYTLDSQKAAIETWSENNGNEHVLPPITPTSDESRELATIMNEISTYRDEMTLKFILGTESLDDFDAYVQNIRNMGLDRALEIQNEALARYNAR